MIRALLLAVALAAPAAALEVPPLDGRVNDRAGLLSGLARRSIDGKLKGCEARTGHQVAVLTMTSLEGEPLEDFSLKAARAWKLGRKGQNDGVLFLISKNDRKLRIEVGHGLEGNIPDALASRIIQNEVVPRFRSGDFEAGITAGVNAITSAVEGNYSPPPTDLRRRFYPRNTAASRNLLLAIVFSFALLGLIEVIGLLTPGTGWVVYFGLIPFLFAIPIAIRGFDAGQRVLLAHLIGFPMIKCLLPFTSFGRKLRREGNRVFYGDTEILSITTVDSGAGGSSLGGGAGGASFGGGSDFSGGGGSFGGGGSSGSW